MAEITTSRGTRARVAELTKEWRRYQSQKWRMVGGIESAMLAALGMYFGEHTITQFRDTMQTRGYTDERDKNKLALVFNMLKKLTHQRIGMLYSPGHEFDATPNKKDPRAFDHAVVVEDLDRALSFKCKERLQQWRRLWWMVLCGVVIEHIPWVEDVVDEPIPQFDEATGELLWKDNRSGQILPQSAVEQQILGGAIPEWFTVCEHLMTVGDIQSHIVSPLNFFIDAACPTIADLPHDQGCWIVEIKGGGFIKDNFGSEVLTRLQSNHKTDLGIIKTRLLDNGPALSSMNVRDMVPAIQGSRAPDDPPMFMVGTRYQPACTDYPHGLRTIMVMGQEILDEGEIPYPQIPLVDLHHTAPTTSFWTPGFLTDLIPAQKFFNKRMSQMGEASNASIYEILLLGGELSPEDVPTDMPGHVEDGIDEAGNPRVVPLQHQELPPWFLESTKAVAEWLQHFGSSSLMMQAQFPGQLRGPLALPILQELIDREDAPLFEHIGDQLALIHQQRINLVKEYYPPIRTLRYTGRDNKNEVLVFHTDDVLRAGTDFTITIDRSTLVPELSALRRARVLEDLNSPLGILYTNPRTGMLDAGRIAMALKYTDRSVEDRQTQVRRLTQHFIKRMWEGQPIPPEIPYPFWDHNAVLDELESAMFTEEWYEASQPVRDQFIGFYERSRAYLQAFQEAQLTAVQNQMLQGAMAQAVQQAAAKAASVATDAALAQVYESASMALPRRIGSGASDGVGAKPGPGGPARRELPARVPAGRLGPGTARD